MRKCARARARKHTGAQVLPSPRFFAFTWSSPPSSRATINRSPSCPMTLPTHLHHTNTNTKPQQAHSHQREQGGANGVQKRNKRAIYRTCHCTSRLHSVRAPAHAGPRGTCLDRRCREDFGCREEYQSDFREGKETSKRGGRGKHEYQAKYLQLGVIWGLVPPPVLHRRVVAEGTCLDYPGDCAFHWHEQVPGGWNELAGAASRCLGLASELLCTEKSNQIMLTVCISTCMKLCDLSAPDKMQKLQYLQDWQPIREQASPLPRDPALQAQRPSIHTTVTCDMDSRHARSAGRGQVLDLNHWSRDLPRRPQ